MDDTYTSANNTSEQLDGLGNPDARFGETDDYWVVDLSGYYQFTKETRLIAGIQNVFDEEYLVSRQPHGPRPGKPRLAYMSVQFDF